MRVSGQVARRFPTARRSMSGTVSQSSASRCQPASRRATSTRKTMSSLRGCVPTLITYRALAEVGLRYGLPPGSHRKVSEVLDHGLRALELAHRGGIDIVFGTDLLGGMHPHQAREFDLRAEVQPTLDVIRSATSVAARLVGLPGRIGEITAGAHADILMVEGDPLQDITVLSRPDKHLKLVLKAGRVMR
ncbi:amidohydrolase family protein [Nonomuraea sp. NPDC049637]|uniref:amidohydrolase family protein n=1 Tax=Nonomuraea sp. NPDC049637 TaxID=3154356 RepID=UPI003433E60D